MEKEFAKGGSLTGNVVLSGEPRETILPFSVKGLPALYTLEAIATRICNSYDADDCDAKCPASDYCRKGHNGMIDWLRKVME